MSSLRRKNIMYSAVFLILFSNFGLNLSFRNVYPLHHVIEGSSEAGEPLFLTPYIQEGKVIEGQKAAEVHLSNSSVASYSGFFTVNKAYNSNIFFWYFPAENDPQNAPVVLWLQGGPGASSMFGLFCEHGPILVDQEGFLKERNISWANVFNMVYIDNPVGTGFSFTEDQAGYAVDEERVGRDLYYALYQFFLLFPKLRGNDFFLVGESYGGKYVPAVGYKIHTENQRSHLKINLKGLVMGNGWTVPEYMLDYGKYLYQLGLIDVNTKDIFLVNQAEVLKNIKLGNFYQANKVMNGLIGEVPSVFSNVTGLKDYYNYVNPNASCGDYAKFLQSDQVRRSIHVGSLTYNNGSEVEKFLYNDTMQSVKPWIEILLEEYRILFYNGQLDIICAYPLTLNVLQHLEWSGSAAYKEAPRKQWTVNGNLAGYSKTAKGMTEVLVRNAGHMVPQDQPQWALDMISKFVFNKGF